jgi:hypothetical protein
MEMCSKFVDEKMSKKFSAKMGLCKIDPLPEVWMPFMMIRKMRIQANMRQRSIHHLH